MTSRKDFQCSRTENAHSANDVMYRVLLYSDWWIDHHKDTGKGTCRPVHFDGINLLVYSVKMNKVFRQGDIREVLGLDAFVIGPLGKGFPMRIINVTGGIM